MAIALLALFAGAAGAALGSFFNVVAYRLPRGQSLVHPPSACPGCQTSIKAYDNVPVLGWLLLGGRCRSCRTAISPRYPIVEGLTAVLAVAVALTASSVRQAALDFALIAVLVPIALIDLDHRLIPNVITLPAAVGAIAIGLATKPAAVPGQLIAGLAAGGFLLFFALLYPRGMGMGDVKLAAVLGLYLGSAVGVAILGALLTGTLVGVGVMAKVGVEKGRKAAIPFGPFLAAGAVIAMFVGHGIVHWYLHSGI